MLCSFWAEYEGRSIILYSFLVLAELIKEVSKKQQRK